MFARVVPHLIDNIEDGADEKADDGEEDADDEASVRGLVIPRLWRRLLQYRIGKMWGKYLNRCAAPVSEPRCTRQWRG